MAVGYGASGWIQNADLRRRQQGSFPSTSRRFQVIVSIGIRKNWVIGSKGIIKFIDRAWMKKQQLKFHARTTEEISTFKICSSFPRTHWRLICSLDKNKFIPQIFFSSLCSFINSYDYWSFTSIKAVLTFSSEPFESASSVLVKVTIIVVVSKRACSSCRILVLETSLVLKRLEIDQWNKSLSGNGGKSIGDQDKIQLNVCTFSMISVQMDCLTS